MLHAKFTIITLNSMSGQQEINKSQTGYKESLKAQLPHRKFTGQMCIEHLEQQLVGSCRTQFKLGGKGGS